MAPGTAKNVIFLWNHCYKDPLSVRNSLVTPADHYTLLEILEPQPKVISEKTFFFHHVNNDGNTDLEDTTEDETKVGKGNICELESITLKQKLGMTNVLSRKKTKKATITSKKEAKNFSQEIEVNNETKSPGRNQSDARDLIIPRKKKCIDVSDSRDSETTEIVIPRKKKNIYVLDARQSDKTEIVIPRKKKSIHVSDVRVTDTGGIVIPKKKTSIDVSGLNDSDRKAQIGTINHSKDNENYDCIAEASSERKLKFDYAKDGCLPPPDYITIPKMGAGPFSEAIPETANHLAFLITDNEGEENCFYESICDSIVFVKENPKFKNNHKALRKDISEHANKNKGLAREIFDAILGINEKQSGQQNYYTKQ
jgi:hypothetical protein